MKDPKRIFCNVSPCDIKWQLSLLLCSTLLGARTAVDMIRAIAIIGKNDEPLYLLGCNGARNNEDDSSNDTEDIGSCDEQQSIMPLFSDQVLLHASLDCLDEMITTVNGQMPVIKKPTSAHPHWVGLLLEDHERALSVYGHVSATNIKFLCLVEADDCVVVSVIQKLLADLHQLYVEEVLNPFFDTKGSIRSAKFDNNVRRAIPGLKGEVVDC